MNLENMINKLILLLLFFTTSINAQESKTKSDIYLGEGIVLISVDTFRIYYDTTVSNGVVVYLSDLENLEIRVKKGCTKTIISNLGWIVDSFFFIKEDDELVEIDDNLVIKFIPIIKQ